MGERMIAPSQHPLSAIFPPMAGEEMAALTEDIRDNGLRNAIVLLDGMVLDGWNRYQACLKAHVKPIYTTYGGKDPVLYVKSLNWHRRHLSASQRAAAEVALSGWRVEGRPAKHGNGCHVSEPLKSNAEMAIEAAVSPRLIRDAKTVHAQGTQALKEAVRDGDIPVHRAAKISKLPARQQAKAMREPVAKVKPAPVGDYTALALAHAQLKEACDELAGELQSCEAIRNGKVAQEMKSLREQLRIASRRRDELMTQVGEMRKQIAYWKRKAEKSEAV